MLDLAGERLAQGADLLAGRLERRPVHEDRSVELVTARLGDDVHDAAGGAAVLGLVSARLDVDLLDEILDEGRAERAVSRIGNVDAIDDVVLLGASRSVHGDAAVRVGLHTGNRGRDLVKGTAVAPVRNQVHLFLRDRAPLLRRVDRDGGPLRDDLDHLLLQGVGHERELHLDGAVEPDGEALLRERLEAFALHVERVRSCRQEGDFE